MRDNDLYIWLHKELGEQGEVTLTNLPPGFEENMDARRFAEEYLDRLVRQDILTNEDEAYNVANADAERQAYYGLIGESTEEWEIPADRTHQPVVSVPSQLQSEWKEFAEQQGIDPAIPLKIALKTVVETAQEKLRITAPYFELDGLNLIDEEFRTVARRGVDVHILTRECLGDPGEYNNNRKRKALVEVIDRYKQHAPATGSIIVKDYHHAIGNSNFKLDRSIHAKMAVADKAIAYVGSGEIRDSSMHLNGEAGYLSQEPAEIVQWSRFFDFFWKKATEAPRSELTT